MVQVSLSQEQTDAKDYLLDFIEHGRPNTYRILHGLAGSGKTTILGQVARERPTALLCTLTGKAASVLRRKTQLPASTIHSIFYRLREERVFVSGKRSMLWDEAFQADGLRDRVLLLDECSMIPTRMAHDLLRTGVKIVACGDPGQLPPVEGAQFFTDPDLTLNQIHRQALESPIIRQAHAVRAGKPYRPDGENFEVIPFAPMDTLRSADTILCWRNTTRRQLNGMVRQARGHQGLVPQAGETVVCLRNNSEYGIFNGATYTLMRAYTPGEHEITIDVDGWTVTVPNSAFIGYDDEHKRHDNKATPFDYGYCLTVHKAQGSEWPWVVVIDEYSMADERAAWVYTAITRASERCTMVNLVRH